jgi:hypothetical protein
MSCVTYHSPCFSRGKVQRRVACCKSWPDEHLRLYLYRNAELPSENLEINTIVGEVALARIKSSFQKVTTCQTCSYRSMSWECVVWEYLWAARVSRFIFGAFIEPPLKCIPLSVDPWVCVVPCKAYGKFIMFWSLVWSYVFGFPLTVICQL